MPAIRRLLVRGLGVRRSVIAIQRILRIESSPNLGRGLIEEASQLTEGASSVHHIAKLRDTSLSSWSNDVVAKQATSSAIDDVFGCGLRDTALGSACCALKGRGSSTREDCTRNCSHATQSAGQTGYTCSSGHCSRLLSAIHST